MMYNFEFLNKKENLFSEDTLMDLTKSFSKDGYLIIENFFSKDTISSFYNYFTTNYNQYFVEKTHDDALTVGNKRYHVTLEFKDVFNNPDFYANSYILQLMTQLLHTKYVIEDLNCVISLPGAQTMHTHRDGIIFTGVPIANLLPAHAIGVLIPLIPFTKETGPTRYWPGSHKTHLSPEQSKDVPFEAPEIDTGTIILMDYRLLHSGSPNLSNQVRPLLYLNYAVNWYFDSNNFQKQAHFYMTNEELAKVEPKFRRLFERRNLKLAGIL